MLSITLRKRFIIDNDDGSFSIKDEEIVTRIPVRIKTEGVLEEILKLELWLNTHSNIRAHLFIE